MPNEPLKGLNTPNTGDLPGAWGTAAVNNNFTVIGGYLGGVQTVSLTNSNVSLSISTGVIGTGSITPGAGPVQADNAVVKFAGTLSGNCTITFPCPGYWIVENNCTVGSFNVSLRAIGTGNVVSAPPGESCHVYNDGTDFKYVNMGRVGELLDLCVSTTPPWMSACSVPPYLPCVGTATYSAATFPALFAMLGSTFGGNGINNFAAPDLRSRVRISLGTGITTAIGGFDGSVLGAAGGTAASAISTSQMPSHTHGVTDSGHGHRFRIANGGGDDSSGGFQTDLQSQLTAGPSATTTPSGTNGEQIAVGTTGISLQSTGGTSVFPVVQPSLVFGVTFIKT